jgi:hypothetical protein
MLLISAETKDELYGVFGGKWCQTDVLALKKLTSTWPPHHEVAPGLAVDYVLVKELASARTMAGAKTKD